jgi:hypothetical protein
VSEESMKDIIKLTLIISHFVLASCTSLPAGYEENPSYVLTDTSDTSAAKKAAGYWVINLIKQLPIL